jgi:hypothetical protein
LTEFTGNVAIAFKYKGSDTESTSIRIDDVIISTDGGGGGGDALPSLNETFDDYVPYDEINKNGWVDLTVAGDRLWIAKEYSGNTYAQATGYNSELDDMETWMISPLVDNTAGDKTLIEWQVDRLVEYGVGKIVVVANSKNISQKFRQASPCHLNDSFFT